MSEHAHRALIVEDDDKIVDLVVDYVESLGHTHARAANQAEARELFAGGKYCYVLLDLEIPVKAKRMALVEHGVNLLEEMRRKQETCRTPIIIMTSHGTDGPYLAVDMMKKGADDYICKPFDSAPDGRAPTDVIKQALLKVCKHAPAHCPALNAPPQPECESLPTEPSEATPFEGGKMVFYPDRVELLACTILTAKGKRFSRPLLDLLAKKDANGRFVIYPGNELARKIDPNGIKGQNEVAGYVRSLRRSIRDTLRKAGVSCGDHDVIVSGGPGYRLNPWIEVEFPDA